jgi:hypothetical protein
MVFHTILNQGEMGNLGNRDKVKIDEHIATVNHYEKELEAIRKRK